MVTLEHCQSGRNRLLTMHKDLRPGAEHETELVSPTARLTNGKQTKSPRKRVWNQKLVDLLPRESLVMHAAMHKAI